MNQQQTSNNLPNPVGLKKVRSRCIYDERVAT